MPLGLLAACRQICNTLLIWILWTELLHFKCIHPLYTGLLDIRSWSPSKFIGSCHTGGEKQMNSEDFGITIIWRLLPSQDPHQSQQPHDPRLSLYELGHVCHLYSSPTKLAFGVPTFTRESVLSAQGPSLLRTWLLPPPGGNWFPHAIGLELHLQSRCKERVDMDP